MTGWTATDVAAKLAELMGTRRRWTSPAAVATAAGLAQRGAREHDTVFARVAARRVAAASPADRKALEAAIAAAGDDRAVVERAIASGARVGAVATFAARWDGLPEPAKTFVRSPLGDGSVGPVTWGNVPAKQVDQTTCGAAAMSMLAMVTDPFVALWVATGQTPADHLAPEVLRSEVLHLPAHAVGERWHSLQRATHHATTRTAVGPLPWPRALGTPPWRVDNVTRCAGVRLQGFVIDDSDAGDLAAALAHAAAALRDGIPVPVYTGGDASQGVDKALPRHVVLLVGLDGGVLRVYEPGSGAVHGLPTAQLTQPHARLKALGNWNRVTWFVLPTPRT